MPIPRSCFLDNIIADDLPENLDYLLIEVFSGMFLEICKCLLFQPGSVVGTIRRFVMKRDIEVICGHDFSDGFMNSQGYFFLILFRIDQR
jgi:hypothetical protein